MNIAASNRLGETAERTTFELDGNVPAQAGGAPSDALAKWAQGRHPNKNSRLSNAADISEMYRSESPYSERRWRWPLSYRSVEALAIFVDALIITILENGLASGKLSGRTVVLISDNQPVSSLQQLLLRHGFRVRRHFVVSEDHSRPPPWDAVISEAIFCARCSDVDEIFIVAEPQNWMNFREMTERLRLLPLPVHLILIGPTAELLKRPVSAIGSVPAIELQRVPLNIFELLIKRTIDILLAGTAFIGLIPILALVASD